MGPAGDRACAGGAGPPGGRAGPPRLARRAHRGHRRDARRDRIGPRVGVFIHSNVPIYVAGRDHPLREPARRFLATVQDAQVEGCTSTEVLQEILYRYVGLRRPALAVELYALFVSLCPVVFPVALADTDRARDLLRQGLATSVRDLVHAAV